MGYYPPREWDEDLYKQLYTLHDLSPIIDTLLEVLDPLQEGVAGCVAEDMDEGEDGEYAGICGHRSMSRL